jgi:hypothetical protein
MMRMMTTFIATTPPPPPPPPMTLTPSLRPAPSRGMAVAGFADVAAPQRRVS